MLQKHVEIYCMFGEGTVSDRTCGRWSENLKSDDNDHLINYDQGNHLRLKRSC